MNDCLFCKIVNNEIPAHKVYEDDAVVAFLDIFPVNPGHVLIVPKKHFNDLFDVDEESLKSLVAVVPRVARLVMTALDYRAFNLFVNNGAEAGQVIYHLHFHVVPRREGDGHRLFAGTKATDEELKAVADKISPVL